MPSFSPHRLNLLTCISHVIYHLVGPLALPVNYYNNAPELTYSYLLFTCKLRTFILARVEDRISGFFGGSREKGAKGYTEARKRIESKHYH